MKVLYLVNSLPNGGLERQLTLLAASLPEDWTPRVWSMGGGSFEPCLRERGVPVIVRERRSRFDVSPAALLWRDVVSWRPDVVHSWGWMPGLAVAPLCRLLRIPYIDGMIRSGAVEPDFPRLKRLGMALATLVVANSAAGLRAWGVGPDKGRVVPNAFDQDRLRNLDAGQDKDPATFTVIMTARMSAAKDFDVVIEAARRLSGAGQGWRFLLVGHGPDRDRLIRLAADLTETGVVSFPQPGLEVLRLVRRADVGVLMTNATLVSEGLSNSIMEYMALGLPVVCGRGGGNAELVQDGATGFVIPPGDADVLAGRLSALRGDRAAGAAMGALGRERILRVFTVPRMVDGMLSVYAEGLARVHAPRSSQHST